MVVKAERELACTRAKPRPQQRIQSDGTADFIAVGKRAEQDMWTWFSAIECGYKFNF
jgi:hypothetical protein